MIFTNYNKYSLSENRSNLVGSDATLTSLDYFYSPKFTHYPN